MTDLPLHIVVAIERLSEEPLLELKLLPVDAFFVVATLQRVLHDPRCHLQIRPEVVRLAKQLEQRVVEQEPSLRQYLAGGWDPSQNLPT
jgi:hypothetical protein